MTHTSNQIQASNLDRIRHRLEQHLQERLDLLAELAPRALPSVDPVAYQTATSNRMVVGQISAALNRLEAGTYGRCTRCGVQISPARLEVVPYAAACIECQNHADAA
jgi:DnaK suppressor protein